jgi:uncharacterized paraquat-inducible protein A
MSKSSSNESIAVKIAEKLIDVLMTLSFFFLLVIAGIKTIMLVALLQSFPFSYFSQNNMFVATVITIFLAMIAVILKLFMVGTKSRLMIETGRNISLSAIAAMLVIILLQVWAVLKVNGELAATNLSDIQQIAKFFVMSSRYSSFVIIACVILFAFGIALKKYGVRFLRQVKRRTYVEQMNKKIASMKEELHNKKRESTGSAQSRSLNLNEYYLQDTERKHPAYYQTGHPIHRYMPQKEQYRREGK